MLIWSSCFFCLFLGLHLLFGGIHSITGLFKVRNERVLLQRVSMLLHEIQETLEAGLIPQQERWEALRGLPAPWGALSYESLQELRSCGGSLLPTLRRLRALAENHRSTLGEARAKASQALAQSAACALLVPFFGVTLFYLLPGVNLRPYTWGIACGGALLLAVSAAVWLLRMADHARWGGLSQEARPWILAAQCAGERFLALIRSGTPADLAWARANQLLIKEAPSLAAHWGSSVWEGPHLKVQGASACALAAAGDSLRKAIQVSLMEGRPCTERVEAVLLALRQDIQIQVDRELSLLATRALKPLFLCVAPSLFGLLVFGLFLSWEQAIGGSGGI